MKHTIQFLLAAFLFSRPFAALGQGAIPFQNLGFESTTVSPLPVGQSEFVSVSAAFPGWIAYWGTNTAPSAAHNGLSSGGVLVSIMGPNFFSILQGNFSAALQAGLVVFPNQELVPASLAQIGVVPDGIRSIRFYSAEIRPEVTFNGQVIPVVLLGNGVSGTGTGYEILGGDISVFAGQSGELRFSSYAAQGQFGSFTLLDNISFSNQQVPEPSASGLFGFGALLFGCRSRLVPKR